MGKVIDKIKEFGGYVLAGLLVVLAIVKWFLNRKETLKDALMSDAPKKAAAEVEKTKAESEKAQADAIENKISNLPEDESWNTRRK
jgi:hypothetical protein